MSHKNSGSEKAVEEVQLSSWEEFKTAFLPNIYGDKGFRRDKYLFRGHGKSEWKLESAFDRQFPISQYEMASRGQLYQDMLDRFRHRLADSDVPENVHANDIRLTALGQHYGLPTRLLDWSESPYFAAFFAFSSNIQYFETKETVAIYVLDRSNPIWNKENGVEIVKVPPFSNTRIRVQQGMFTLQRTPELTIDAFVETMGKKGALRKIIIPANEARKVIADLDAAGITFDSVFNDLEGIAKSAFFQTVYENPTTSSP